MGEMSLINGRIERAVAGVWRRLGERGGYKRMKYGVHKKNKV